MGCPTNYVTFVVHGGKTQSFSTKFLALLPRLVLVPNEEHFENGQRAQNFTNRLVFIQTGRPRNTNLHRS